MFNRIVDFVSFGEPVAANWYELIGKFAVAGAVAGAGLLALTAAILFFA